VTRGQLAELSLLDLGGGAALPGAAQAEHAVDRISWVSRIGLAPGEHPAMEALLQQAETLAQAASAQAGDDAPLRTVAPAPNRMRPGTEAARHPLAASGDLLKQAPAVKGGFYKVAPVLESHP